MATEVETPQHLAAHLGQGGYRRVGIDGIDGCGKTTLARHLSSQLGLPVISLDEYLNKDRGRYVGHLRYADLKRDFRCNPQCIVEGVCLLQVLEVAGLEIDTLVYVKRMQHSVWADETECEIDEGDVDEFLEEQRELIERISGQPGYELPSLMEERVRYHASYRPFRRADFWYLRDDF